MRMKNASPAIFICPFSVYIFKMRLSVSFLKVSQNFICSIEGKFFSVWIVNFFIAQEIILEGEVIKRNRQVLKDCRFQYRFFEFFRTVNNKRLMIHCLRSEDESNSDCFFWCILGYFDTALRISDWAKVISFVKKNILSVKCIWEFLGWNEIADEFIFQLPLLRRRKFAFTIDILNVLDSWYFCSVGFFIRLDTEMKHCQWRFPTFVSQPQVQGA